MTQISINPVLTTNALGSFGTTWNGLIQGTAFDDPAIRFKLSGGILDSAEALPLWGGVGISLFVPGAGANPPLTALGAIIKRSTALTGAKALAGFSVFDQNYSAVNSPQSNVPLVGQNMTANFYRLGSGARIALAAAPSLVSLDGGLETQQVSWDFAAQELVPFAPAYANVTVTGAVWANTAGGQTTYAVGTDLTAVLAAGSVIDVSGVISTGGTGVGFNGNFVVVSVPDSTHVVVTQAAASSPGTYSSGGVIAGGGGALPCKILEVQQGNCMTVTYDPVTGFASWNRNGSAAVILI